MASSPSKPSSDPMRRQSDTYDAGQYGYQDRPSFSNNETWLPTNHDRRPTFNSVPSGLQGQQFNPNVPQHPFLSVGNGQHPYVLPPSRPSDMWVNPPSELQYSQRIPPYQPYSQPFNVQQPAPQPPATPINSYGYGLPPNGPRPPLPISAQGRHSFLQQRPSERLPASNISASNFPSASHDSQSPLISLPTGRRPSDASNHMSHQMSSSAHSYLSMESPSLLNSVFSLDPGQSTRVAYVRLEVRALSLRKKDTFGSSDPICFLQIPPARTLDVNESTKWTSIDKTEVLRNTLEPAWTKQFRLPYLFGENQLLRFWLVDVDNHRTDKHSPEEGDFLGMCVLKLADIVRNTNCYSALSDRRGREGKNGKLFVRAHDENTDGRVLLDLTLSGEKLLNVERFGKSDPFYRLSYVPAGGGLASTLTTSHTVKSNLNPQWGPVQAIIHTEGQPWKRIPLVLSVWDENRFEKHRSIGDCKVTLGDLVQKKQLNLVNQQRQSPRQAGTINVNSVKVQELPRFISFIQGGLKLKFSVAVDFTASNKNVMSPESLHYVGDPNSPNVYQTALRAVGTVISSYLYDDTITALGFGAKLPGLEETSYDFALNGQGDGGVLGVDGLLEAYACAARNVRLSRPSKFAPLIRNTAKSCEENPVSQENQYFTILLIITNGALSDKKETIDAIIDASYTAPLSIVIVGVGDGDFTEMRELDSDDTFLTSVDGQRKAKYDIVQFVQYEDSMSLERLAAEVLHEVPERLVQYMVDAGIKPMVPSNEMMYQYA